MRQPIIWQCTNQHENEPIWTEKGSPHGFATVTAHTRSYHFNNWGCQPQAIVLLPTSIRIPWSSDLQDSKLSFHLAIQMELMNKSPHVAYIGRLQIYFSFKICEQTLSIDVKQLI